MKHQLLSKSAHSNQYAVIDEIYGAVATFRRTEVGRVFSVFFTEDNPMVIKTVLDYIFKLEKEWMDEYFKKNK